MILRPRSREKGIGAVELLEQATALLRQAPLDTLACYYLGTVPFMLVLLWFLPTMVQLFRDFFIDLMSMIPHIMP